MKEELFEILPKAALQMAVKAVNNTIGLDSLMLTLFIFSTYLQMTEYNPPAPIITQHATTVKKAITKIYRIRAQYQIADTVNIRNRPLSTAVYYLPLNSDVLVWREGNTRYAGK